MTIRSDLRASLRDLGLAAGETVLVHSGLSGMACEPIDLLDTLQDVLGDDGTVVVPTFTPAFRHESPDGVFDLQETPSEVGYFTELVRTHSESTRSLDPTHSFAAIGELADRIGRCHEWHTYDRNNVLGLLHELDAWLLAVGLEPWGRSMTFFHYVEQQEGVSRRGWEYRVPKSFSGTVVVNGKRLNGRYTIHVQNFERGVTYDFGPIGDRLSEEGLVNRADAVDKEFIACRTGEIYDAVAEMIVEEPETIYTVGGR